MTGTRNVQGGRLERRMNRFVARLAGRGLRLPGIELLAVRGRTSGEWRTTPVHPMAFEGERYLVAPRGHTQWVRNIRAAGGGELRRGRRTEAFEVVELPDTEKAPVVREYLDRFGWEVARFFDGPVKDPSDERLAELAPGVPVFRIVR
ncbi:nitroreductase/quinone reductase family protein [Actinomadura flavalba]|uniref:nitroreductase/quinone reductase family protein n=1 Tax=Actinomadura flavalba TaxID=1120938 RepID=UPI0003773FBE|nr:nitroreductase/quinone reductase family protein [Actinomadura flavalba]